MPRPKLVVVKYLTKKKTNIELGPKSHIEPDNRKWLCNSAARLLTLYEWG